MMWVPGSSYGPWWARDLVRQTSTDQGNNRDDSGKCSEQKGCLNYFEGWRWRLQNIAGPINNQRIKKQREKLSQKWACTGTVNVSLK